MQTISSGSGVVGTPHLPVSPHLVATLEQLIPARAITPSMTQNEIMFEAGKQYVIAFLKSKVQEHAAFAAIL